jgi:ERCC4-type nuclease
VKLFVDKREPSDFRIPLIEMGFKEKMLKSGDVLIGELLLEHKKASQFITDWFSGQLDDQVHRMHKSPYKPAILFEWESLDKIGRHIGRMESHLTTLNLVIPIIESSGNAQSIRIVQKLVTDAQKGRLLTRRRPIIVNPTKGTMSAEQRCAISALARLPGVGETRATAVLKEFGTLKNAIRNVKKWNKQVDGIGGVTAKKVIATVYYEFGVNK